MDGRGKDAAGKGERMLHVEGRDIVDDRGEKILLNGWGIGNWLCPEGYMWKAYNNRFDRPRRIRQVIGELTGEEYAAYFWRTFEDTYIRKADLEAMKQAGFNSVRIPFIYSYFMEEGLGIRWKSRGFELLDRCVEWCRELGLYVILDLHGAPGGQTGSNIDDSVDDVPRLFLERENREKAVALWERLAERYLGNETIAMYDLLNEPIMPPEAGNGDHDFLIPQLLSFYEEVTRAVRRKDPDHIISVEGYHWATEFAAFERKWDDNMVLHFHRYAEPPDIDCLRKYLDAGERLGLPVWMGETGENKNTWYAALYPLAQSLQIGFNLWPWKKMDCTNSFCSIKVPEGYEEILAYLEGGIRPARERAQAVLNVYLENIRFENCTLHPETADHVFRRRAFTLQAVDFDEFPGEGRSFHGLCHGAKPYRKHTSMEIVEMHPAGEKAFAFDCGWDRYGLALGPDEFVVYSFSGTGGKIAVEITFADGSDGEADVELMGGKAVPVRIRPEAQMPVELDAVCADPGGTERLKVSGVSGRLVLDQIRVKCIDKV